jgi:hypothetical protein
MMALSGRVETRGPFVCVAVVWGDTPYIRVATRIFAVFLPHCCFLPLTTFDQLLSPTVLLSALPFNVPICAAIHMLQFAKESF